MHFQVVDQADSQVNLEGYAAGQLPNFLLELVVQVDPHHGQVACCAAQVNLCKILMTMIQLQTFPLIKGMDGKGGLCSPCVFDCFFKLVFNCLALGTPGYHNHQVLDRRDDPGKETREP